MLLKRAYANWRVSHKHNLHFVNLREAELARKDLSEANMCGANLVEADLWKANLNKADMRRSNLNLANISEATLIGADLRGANLYNADLREANLTGADLRGADLRESNLYEATLTGVKLEGAKLDEANMRRVNTYDFNITEADVPETFFPTTSVRVDEDLLLKVCELLIRRDYLLYHKDFAYWVLDCSGFNWKDKKDEYVHICAFNLVGDIVWYFKNKEVEEILETMLEVLIEDKNNPLELYDADLRWAHILKGKTFVEGSSLTNCDLSYLDLRGTDLSNLELKNCELMGVLS